MSPEGLTRTTALSNRPPRAPSCRAIREGASPQASIGKGVAPDEVAPPDLDAIDAEIARRDIDQPPQREGGYRAAGAAIGVGRHGVRKDHLYLAVDRRGWHRRQRATVHRGWSECWDQTSKHRRRGGTAKVIAGGFTSRHLHQIPRRAGNRLVSAMRTRRDEFNGRSRVRYWGRGDSRANSPGTPLANLSQLFLTASAHQTRSARLSRSRPVSR
jgi:hypothetical protein